MAEGVRDCKHELPFLDKCILCSANKDLKLCARCKSVSYCSKEHQKAHWTDHKRICKQLVADQKTRFSKLSDAEGMNVVTDSIDTLSINTDGNNVTSTGCESKQNNKRKTTSQMREHGESLDHTNTYISAESQSSVVSATELNKSEITDSEKCSNSAEVNNGKQSKVKTFSGRKTEQKFPQKTEINGIDGDLGVKELDTEQSAGSSELFILESENQVLSADFKKGTKSKEPKMPLHIGNDAYLSIVESRNKALSEYVTKCLNAYGICVIDNFLGDQKGTDILEDVKDLYGSGELSSGQLVNASTSSNIRGDVITWVDGTEQGCSNVSFLISSIDAIMLHCHKTLGTYSIKGRSKAMVAVYPGKETGFLRHIDNPSGDGRCVTCIYYINRDWNSKTDGGLLRIFPEGQNRMANVEPKFDRLLFFWSDRRNPHEVLPAHKTRYAVTVWYYDEEERKQAVKRFKGGQTDEKSLVYPLNGSNRKY